ncbi:MAG: hypothetical protein M3N19_08410, partial [Candidatus Eremiobacteraeota bacterium]|nr:hypothetical protein [Candidatus Eremiobacteraeota bacterium]
LEMPRFLRRGDQSTLLGLVNGRPSSTNASLSLDAGDLLRAGSPDARIALDGSASGSAQWIVNPLTSLGIRQITLSGTDGVLSDAMRLPLPIEAAGATEHVRDAGEVHDRNALTLTLPAMYDPGELRITMAPSVVASLIQNVQLLDIYPYYCTEQTMSAALPAVFVDRLLKRTGLPQPQDAPATGAIVTKGIARLRELQHEDGSWGWWESDDGHPFMTAYALYGLAEFKKAGYAVPQAMVDRGVASLQLQMKTANQDTLRYWGGRQKHSEWNTRAFMLYALADVAPRQVDASLLAQTMQHTSDLNSYALAVLGLAQHELGNDRAAREVLAALNARATTDGAYTFWLGQTWEYGWEDDPIETTAYALRLNTALEPQSARVGTIVNFLRAQQHGSWWYTTKDTAAAVYALSETVPASSPEFHPNEDLKIFAGDKLIDRLHIDRAVLTSKDGTITVPASDFEHGGTLRFEVSGAGSLYWATDWVRYAPPYARQVADASESLLSRLRAKPSAFSIDRKYTAKRWPWQIGDEITVDVNVRVASDTQYVAVEDPFPAGVEYQPLQGEAGNSWSGVQFFDDRAVFFADRLSSNYPLHLQYTLRVTTAGTYTAAPPIAYAMYGPPVSTVGQPDKVTVRQ